MGSLWLDGVFFLISGFCTIAGILPEMVEEPERHDQGYGEGAHQLWTIGVNVCSLLLQSCHFVGCSGNLFSVLCYMVNDILFLVLKKWGHVHAR